MIIIVKKCNMQSGEGGSEDREGSVQSIKRLGYVRGVDGVVHKAG